MRHLKTTLPVALAALVTFSCQSDLQESESALSPQASANGLALQGKSAQGSYVLYTAEYITSGEGGHLGNIVYFNNRGNKRLSSDFVPGLSVDGTDAVTYYVDNKRPSNDLAAKVTEAAVDRAMKTWDNATCSNLRMQKLAYDGRRTGVVAASLGYGRASETLVDILHAGWLPGSFFDLLAEGGSKFILAATFTYIFVDGAGNPTDVNNDGYYDAAFREIYYNDAFTWNDGSHFDVETIALHEAGHALSQGHFGKAFVTLSNGALHFSPRAVMNAAYSGIQTEITSTDASGHCGIWADWK